MCHLMASDKLEEQIPKLIPAILSLYKKNNEHYVISKVGNEFVTFFFNKQDCHSLSISNRFLTYNKDQ